MTDALSSDHNLDKAACDDWTKIPVHCTECGAQFLRKVRHQKYCDEHRHMAGAVIRPQEALTSKEQVWEQICADVKGCEEMVVGFDTEDILELKVRAARLAENVRLYCHTEAMPTDSHRMIEWLLATHTIGDCVFIRDQLVKALGPAPESGTPRREAGDRAGPLVSRHSDETAGRIGPIEPDNDLVICPTCTSQFRAIPVNVQQELRAVLRESDVLQFIGWLSGDIPELHSVEVPRLAQSWNDFRGTQQVISSGPIPPVEPSPLREPTAFQDFVASLPEKATALPIEAQCSWGCHYVGDQFIRYAACTVHGASGNGSEEQT